ncbi:unnamed protein product [Schistosoma margrebowiei]|uniref:EGF-like domain-containing protein n=1 Tax=Schistosoma margrebowiei TaxID=48269 RepID=A0AA85ANL1_9TREM|nr:unnamed protein product [Schistosoma margrebowiei]
MTKNILFIHLFLLFIIIYIFIFNINDIKCTTVNDLLIYPNRHKKLFKIIHYLIRQCAPYCLNYGKLEKPDMPWKKCYCLCPDNYYGIACEFNRNHEEIDIDNNNNGNDNNQLLSNMHHLKSNSLPFSYDRPSSSSSSSSAAAASSYLTRTMNNNNNNNNQGNDNDQQMIFVK